MRILTTLDARKIMRGLLALAGAALLGFAGQSQFANGGLTRDALILFGAGIILFLLAVRPREDELPAPAPARPMGIIGWALVAVAVGLTAAATWILARQSASNLALWLWLAGIAVFLIAFARTIPRPQWRVPREELLILAAILLLGLFLRVWKLGEMPPGLYLDEADNALWGIKFVQQPYTPFTEHRDSNATMFYQLAGLSLRILGTNDGLAMRWQDIAVGMLTILVFYVLARSMFGVRPAQIATTLLAVSRWHINFSRLAFVEIVPVPLIEGLVILFLWRGYQKRRLADFAFAGFFLGLGLHTYIGYRIFPLTAALCIVFFMLKHRGWLRQHLMHLSMFILGALLAVAPLGIFVVQRPQIFLRRAQAASVMNDIEREKSYRPLTDNIQKTLLMFNQEGDPRPRHNLPKAPMLDFWTAIAFGLGWGYALWNWRRSRYFIPLIWMLLGFLTSIFSLNDSNPHSSRTLGNVMPVFLLVAVFWDGAARSVAQVALGHVRKALAGGLAVVLCFSAVLNYQIYFIKEAGNQNVYYDFDPVYNAAAQFIKANADQNMLLVSFALSNHSAVKFIPYGKQYANLDPNRHIPLRDPFDRDVIYVLEMPHAYFLPTLRTLYPAGELEEHKDRYGATAFYTFKLTRQQVADSQGVTAQFYAGATAEGQPATAQRSPRLDVTFSAGDPLPAPFTAVWDGALYVPGYGQYTLVVDAAGPTEVKLGEETILKTDGGEPSNVRRVLPGGFQPLQVVYHQTGPEGRIALRWIPPTGNEADIPQSSFYAPEMARFGLLGRYFRGSENWSGQPALAQIDPFVAANDVIPAPFSIEWQGMIYIPEDGQYNFATISDDGSYLYIDNNLLVDNGGHHGDQRRDASVRLTKGYHPIGIRYFQIDGGRKLELWWTAPGRPQEQVPATYLLPPGASQDKLPPPPLPPVSQPAKQPTPQPSQPAQGGQAPAGAQLTALQNVTLKAAWGGEGEAQGKLRAPRGVAVGPQGLIYVADSGNKRVQVFKADGTFVRSWNKGAEPMVEPFDMVVDSAGRVFVLDAGRQVVSRFSAEGQFQVEFGADLGTYGPRGIGIGPDDAIYLADTGNSRVFKLSPDGQMLATWGAQGTGRGELRQPTDVAVDAQGRIYVTDLLNTRLQVWDAGGAYQGEWRLNGANTTDSPHLVVTQAGRVIVSDPEAHKVLVFDGRGSLINEIGGEGTEPGLFRKALGVGLGPGGVLAATDVYNNRVQVFSIGDGS